MSRKFISFLSIFLLFHLSNSVLEEDIIPLEINIVCKNSYFIFGKEEGAFTFETDYTDDSNIFDQKKLKKIPNFKQHIHI